MATEPLHEIAPEIRHAEALAQARADLRTLIESIVLSGDIGGLTEDERKRIMLRICTDLRLDPAMGAICILKTEDGHEQFYIKGKGTDQLAQKWGVQQKCLEKPSIMDLGDGHRAFVARWSASFEGREIDDIGAVPVPQTSWDTKALCNAMMHANTKARRRATLAVLGIGLVDESELDTMRVRDDRRGGASRVRGTPARAIGNHTAPAADSAAADGFNEREWEPDHADLAPVTALDRLRDDLSQLEGPQSVEQLALLWVDAGIGPDDGEEARSIVLPRGPEGLKPYALGAAVRIEQACRKHTELAAVRRFMSNTQTLDEVVSASRGMAAMVSGLDAYAQTIATDIAERRVRWLDPSIKQPGAWLRKALAATQPAATPSAAPPITTDSNDADAQRPAARTNSGGVIRFQTTRTPRV